MVESDQAGHYFDAKPSTTSRRRTVELSAPDMAFTLTTDRGVFSGGRIDPGTSVLLHGAPRPPRSGEILDLGTGYGPIALTMAKRSPRARIWAIDVNERALELVRDNAERLGVRNVVACRAEDVPEELSFSAIYSNPPVRIGKAALHQILTRWLDRLTTRGRAYLVVQRNLGSDSLARWLNDQGYPTQRLISKNTYRILETKPQTS